jgi:hypothetical protein
MLLFPSHEENSGAWKSCLFSQFHFLSCEVKQCHSPKKGWFPTFCWPRPDSISLSISIFYVSDPICCPTHFKPTDRGSRFHQNISSRLYNNMATQPRKTLKSPERGLPASTWQVQYKDLYFQDLCMDVCQHLLQYWCYSTVTCQSVSLISSV